MEFPLIYSETSLVKVPKIHEIHQIYDPGRKSALRYCMHIVINLTVWYKRYATESNKVKTSR